MPDPAPARIGDPRRHTPDVITVHPNGITSTRVTLKRCCNGCGNELGDADSRDLTWGGELTDVTSECPTCTPSPKGATQCLT